MNRSKRAHAACLGIMMSTAFISACGYKGPLVMPDYSPVKSSAPSAVSQTPPIQAPATQTNRTTDPVQIRK